MDDPLIGLTIYDSTSKAHDASSDVQRRGEDCFPCLPSIPDEDKLKTTGSSPKLESNVTRSKVGHQNHASEVENTVASHQPKNFWLMRLFQSSLFDMSIAIGYLFNSKDHSVQSYLGSRLFVSDFWGVSL